MTWLGKRLNARLLPWEGSADPGAPNPIQANPLRSSHPSIPAGSVGSASPRNPISSHSQRPQVASGDAALWELQFPAGSSCPSGLRDTAAAPDAVGGDGHRCSYSRWEAELEEPAPQGTSPGQAQTAPAPAPPIPRDCAIPSRINPGGAGKPPGFPLLPAETQRGFCIPKIPLGRRDALQRDALQRDARKRTRPIRNSEGFHGEGSGGTLEPGSGGAFSQGMGQERTASGCPRGG